MFFVEECEVIISSIWEAKLKWDRGSAEVQVRYRNYRLVFNPFLKWGGFTINITSFHHFWSVS